jgi:hypothetical protein
VLREPAYGADQAVRRIRPNGGIKWRGDEVHINQALAGEPVGLNERDDGWHVSFGPVALGIIAHGDDRLRKPRRETCGLVERAARAPQGPQEQKQPQQPQ